MIATGGGTPLINPLVPLAWAFRVTGHDVRLVGKPHLGPALTDTALPVVTLGRPPDPKAMAGLRGSSFYDDDRPWPKDWPAHPDALEPWQRDVVYELRRYTLAVAAGMADDLVAFARQWRPDLILYEPLALSVTAAPDVCCVLTAHGTQDVWRMDHDLDGNPLPEYVELLARFGAEPPTGLPHYVDTMPPSMYIGGERPCATMRWVVFNGKGVAPDSLPEPRRRPRVCVSWGMSTPRALGASAVDPYRDAIAAALKFGAEVLVHAPTEQLANLGAPPDGVRYLAETPLNLILPHCDLHVHHGGQGSAMTAAALGIPQLVITRDPMLAEQADRTVTLGAGIHFRYRELAADGDRTNKVHNAIDELLSTDEYLESATDLRQDIERQPAPADLVATLATLAT
ncbi:MAG TPA: glycosyltransferase [Actinophytocola sp.]|jgi:glycosyltransferase|uniref:glycosyltransferase n=1 Tax=Actinophytocola sp. TaxID=1872138 RepID=UPI002E0230A5|nr:glycosyltransferase [Actinophytocola sp.]